MTPELWAALVGAVSGSLLTVLGGWVQQRALEASRMKSRIDSEKLNFVRQLMGNRFDQRAVALLLNEIPILFGDDSIAIGHYRSIIDAPDKDASTQHLGDLIIHLAKSVGLSEKVRESDIWRGITSAGS